MDYKYIKEQFFEIFNPEILDVYSEKAVQAYRALFKKINIFCKSFGKGYGNGYFFNGMYLRIALSVLIDSDWNDTACFFKDIPLEKRLSTEETYMIWEECIRNFEQYMKSEVQNNSQNGNVLNNYRQEISDSCRKAAESDRKLYRLTVPTGAGKTFSSLRFALYHAKRTGKQHIIYIAPFTSI